MKTLADLSEYDLMELTAHENGSVEYATFDNLLREAYEDNCDGAEDAEPVGSVMFHFPKNGFPLPLEREVKCWNGKNLFYQPTTQWISDGDYYIVEYEVV